MSFATDVKSEISLLKVNPLEETVELSAIVRNNGINNKKEIILTIENPKVVRKIFAAFKRLYDINPVVNQVNKANFTKKVICNIVITDKVETILKDLMVLDNHLKPLLRPKEYFVDTEDLARAYLRGAFLACGSVNDPKTSRYHLEFLVDIKEEAEFLVQLLIGFEIVAKIISRDKGYMVYVKESEKIGDFLRIINASRAVMYYEDIRIYRDHKNMTNRLNNCEQANVDKTIEASERQIKDIDLILKVLGLDLVDEKLGDVMLYRKKYPDLSLNELSNVISYETGMNITKSGLNHRMRKIHEVAERLKDKNKK